MNEHYLYLCVDFCCIIVPLVASFHPAIKFYIHWRKYFPVMLSIAAFFIVWDIYFTTAGIWSFNNRYLLGYYFFNLPIEEVAFFVCIPYACMFTYYCFSIFLHPKFKSLNLGKFTLLLATLLMVIAVINYKCLYTSVTFSLLSITFFTIVYFSRSGFLQVFYLAYLANLIPFFISNGILTGSWIAEPVVKYNDTYNLQIRVLTIPAEDFFYGMLLQLANAAGFYYFLNRTTKESVEEK